MVSVKSVSKNVDVVNFYISEMKQIKGEYSSGKNVNLILASVIEVSVYVGERVKNLPSGQKQETLLALQRLLKPKWWQSDSVWLEVLAFSKEQLSKISSSF